jgi:peptidoglycan hydrolase-like protein with peptidoglycan-binding domain
MHIMPTFMRNLWLTSPMMRGGDIAQAQTQLNSQLGGGLSCDGIFGRGTHEAVLTYQRRNVALKADGVVGKQTWDTLFGLAGSKLADRVTADILDPASVSALESSHGYYPNSVKWRLQRTAGAAGVVIDGESGPMFGAGESDVVARVLEEYFDALTTVLSRVQVPIELVIACICTESSGHALAERHEPGCSTIDPACTPSRISVGLMQTLVSTASSVLGRNVAPAELRKPVVSIEAGATYMWRQSRATRFDPPLAACAYNAGSLRYNSAAENRWKLVQYPIGTSAHADRFVRFFNAAMNLQLLTDKLNTLQGRVPSMR